MINHDNDDKGDVADDDDVEAEDTTDGECDYDDDDDGDYGGALAFCFTNSLDPKDGICRHGSAPIKHLNQCWLTIKHNKIENFVFRPRCVSVTYSRLYCLKPPLTVAT